MYAFDTSSISILQHYYLDKFTNFWSDINRLINDGKILSTRQVKKELEERFNEKPLKNRPLTNFETWLVENKHIFLTPTNHESSFFQNILLHERFKALKDNKRIIAGRAFADPWVVALAKHKNACVITEEKERPHSLSIPNICREFNVRCMNFNGFMDAENLSY